MARRLIWLFLILPTLFPPIAQAQDPPPPVTLAVKAVAADDTPLVADDQFPTLSVELAPVNEAGVPLSGLRPDAFTVREDDRPAAPFTVEPFIDIDQPISLMLVLDTSAGMQEELAGLQTAVSTLIPVLSASDEVGIVAFAGPPDGPGVNLSDPFPQLNPQQENAFTGDANALRNVLNAQLPRAASSAPIYDALFKSIRLAATQARHPRRAVILITNGADNGSQLINAELAIEEARRYQIPVFTIGIGGAIDAAFLQRAAILSGGRFEQASGGAAAASLLPAVAQQLKQAYRITLTSQLPGDNSGHTLSVIAATSLGVAYEALPYRARPPQTPQADAVDVVLANGQRLSLATVRSIRGAVTIEPTFTARYPLTAVSYYLNDSETAVFTATAPPWRFGWNSWETGAAGGQSLVIEAIDDQTPPNVGRFRTELIVEPCALSCRWGVAGWQLALGAVGLLGLVAAPLLIWAARRRQPRTNPTQDMIWIAPEIADATTIPPPSPPVITPSVGLAPAQPITAELIDMRTRSTLPLTFDMKIGSAPDNHMVLEGDGVAEQHAWIKRESAGFVLLPLSQTAETRVNGRPIQHRTELVDADRIQIGGVTLLFKQRAVEDA